MDMTSYCRVLWMRVHSDLWTWLSSGRNTELPWLISTGSSNSLMPTEWLVPFLLPRGIFPIQSETPCKQPPKMSSLSGHSRDVVVYDCYDHVRSNLASSAVGNRWGLLHVLNGLFILKVNFLKKNPVPPIEKFPSLVLSSNAVMLSTPFYSVSVKRSFTRG